MVGWNLPPGCEIEDCANSVEHSINQLGAFEPVKRPSRCMGCFKPGRKLFCHTLFNDDGKIPVGETWICRMCQTSFENFRASKGNVHNVREVK